MPTFCALAGCRIETDLKWDGRDLTPLLLQGEKLPDRPLYAVAPGWRARSLRYGDWKLIVHATKPNPKLELFNLANAPAESRNLAGKEPVRLKEMQNLLDHAAARDRDAVVEK